MSVRTHGGILYACVALAACATNAPPESARAAAAIRAVLAEDTELGGVRNHAPESMPLAEAIRAYIAGLDAIDFSECPADFTAAFKRHRDAWQEAIDYFERHDQMRGELHDLFEEIRGFNPEARMRIESIEAKIWSTWTEVERAVDRRGGGSD